MSWSIGTTVDVKKAGSKGRVAAVTGALNDARDAAGLRTVTPPESGEQMDAAIEVASKLVSFVVPDKACKINVTLAGHANPDHKPTEGYSNDSISVYIGQSAT